MAKSKILPLQDSNGNGLIDICEEVVVIDDPKECPECVPNPNAIVPNWHPRTRYEPYLNEKICHYQVAIVAKNYDNTGLPEPQTASEEEALEALEAVFDEYYEEALKGMLLTYNKDDSQETLDTIKEVVEYKKYWLPPRPKSRLKLLYSVPIEYIDALDERDDDEEEEDDATDDIEVTFSADELGPMMMRVRKTLKLYGSRYLKVYRGIDKGNILREKDNKAFNLEDYGDWGFGNGIMADVLPQLDGFLNKYGFNLANIGSIFNAGTGVFNANDRVTEITFTFGYRYELKKISFYTEECGGKPIEYNKSGKLKGLTNDSPDSNTPWTDPTAMSYLANLREFDTDIQARVPEYWITLIKRYTYPEVYETQTQSAAATAGSCVAEALQNEMKELGQDILDDVFSLGDAIAYKFHEQLCKKSLGEALDEKVKLGQVYDPVTGTTTDIYSMAMMQAFQTLEDQDQVFMELCARLLNSGASADVTSLLDKLWSEGLDDIKLCGLFDMMTDAINCLLGGLTFEEAMSSIVEAALRGMSINNFGDLFVGLPPDKQAELDELVKEKLESGELFSPGSSLQAASDSVASSGETDTAMEGASWEEGVAAAWTAPWNDDSLSEEDKQASSSGLMTHEEQQQDNFNERTLVQQLDVGSEENRNQLSSNVVLEAYIKALLEVYQENFLDLIDELNKFPGAQLIANIIALLDCPRPAFFNPGLFDFIKDLELPFCRDLNDISFPRLQNPYGWLPKIMDILSILKEAFMYALQQLIITIIIRLIVKVCELIGNALCAALGAVGDVIGSLPDLLTGRDTLKDVIKESICGEDADDQMVDDAIVEILGALGPGGAALADTEKALTFAGDVSGALTRRELQQMMLGDASDESLRVVKNIVDTQYEDYRDGLPNKEAIGSMFKGMGNLFPADFKDTMRQFVDELPENDQIPANPSLCATPAQLEAFKEMRCEILEGRATPEQCDQMYEDMRDQMKEDLGDLQKAQNWPDWVESNMPPLVSDPGCDNGLMPFEPDVAIQTATTALGNELEQLKVDYSTDMIGNGPFERNWGLVNMVLSDTKAHPLTAHMRKVNNRNRWVDFYVPDDPDLKDFFEEDSSVSSLGLSWSDVLSVGGGMAAYDKQRAAYPSRVAEYLRRDLETKGSGVTISLANDPTGTSTKANAGTEWGEEDYWPNFDRETSLDKKDMGTRGLFQGNIDFLKLPDFGFNVDMETYTDDKGQAEGVNVIEKGRKQDPDIVLEFQNNADGQADYDDKVTWSYGFELMVYFADIEEDPDEEGVIINRPDDNVRIMIVEKFNQGSANNRELKNMMTDDQWDDYKENKKSEKEDVILDDRYEFMGVDNTLTELKAISGEKTGLTSPNDPTPADSKLPSNVTLAEILNNYTEFLNTFQGHQNYQPPTILLKEILNFQGDAGISSEEAKDWRTDVMENALEMILAEVAANTGSWSYGAKYDALSSTDVQYGFNEDGEWVSYSDYEITESDGGTRSLRNKDMKLGISYNQYLNDEAGTSDETRVFYLDPTTYGGNYMNPAVYIKPLKNDGWLGMVDVLFPELSPCKPQTSDLVDFGSIQQIVEDVYPNIPEDERLRSDPDCVIEKPYNRILMRPAKAGLVGLIKAAIRIYGSAHFIKALPVFTTFGPKFPESYSALYAAYIIERMEETFKDARGPDWVMFNVFSDHEFWYAFLEQSVQIYSVLVDEGKINPPPLVLEALFRLNDLQESYDYPFKTDLKEAKKLDEAPRFQTLKSYRQDMNLEAVRESEEDAKLVLKELVMEELDFLATKFMANLKTFNMTPKAHNLDYYVLDNMCAGSSLTLNSVVRPDGSFEASYVDIESEEGDEYYTSGSQFVVGEDTDQEGLTKGEEYVGYYNIELDDEDLPVWRAGEFFMEDEDQDLLIPMVNSVQVLIGDVPELGVAAGSEPFYVEKYISVNGTRYTTSNGVTEVKDVSDLGDLISEQYPGDPDPLEIVYDDDGNAVGLEGKLGVRYGLVFGVMFGATKYEVTAVEVDALDTTIRTFETLDADSKLLLCLVNLLIRDEHYKLMTRYIVPLSKFTAIAAIYTDMAFLPSINQLSVEEHTAWKKFVRRKVYKTSAGKPGLTAAIKLAEDEDGSIYVESVEELQLSKDTMDNYDTDSPPTAADADEDLEGTWSHIDDRTSFWSWGVLEYDDWDQDILINSTYRIKKLFRTYYNSRDFDPDDIGKATGAAGPGSIFFKRMRDALRPSPGKRLLPLWRKRRLVTNPFNANGELCENED